MTTQLLPLKENRIEKKNAEVVPKHKTKTSHSSCKIFPTT